MYKALQDIVIFVIEDNNDFTLLVKFLLEQIGCTNILTASSYSQALTLVDKHSIDVILLDIDLGESKNGVMLAEEIRRRDPHIPIIYITSNYTDKYYAYARSTRPSGFMNKELSRLKLHQAIDLALLNHPDEPQSSAKEQKSELAPNISPYNFYFRIGDVYKAFPIVDIHYFYSDKKMSFAKIGSRSYPTSVQLKTLEEELPGGQFIRIHKSYIINTKFIESIHPSESSVFINGESLPIGDAYRKEFMAVLRLLK